MSGSQSVNYGRNSDNKWEGGKFVRLAIRAVLIRVEGRCSYMCKPTHAATDQLNSGGQEDSDGKQCVLEFMLISPNYWKLC